MIRKVHQDFIRSNVKLVCIKRKENEVSYKFSFYNGNTRRKGAPRYSKGHGYPTWFPILGSVVQTIVLFTRYDQEVFAHTFIRLKDIGDQPNERNSTFKVVTYLFSLLVVINPITS